LTASKTNGERNNQIIHNPCSSIKGEMGRAPFNLHRRGILGS